MSILLRELTEGLETCEEIVRRDSFDFSEDDKGQLLGKMQEV